MKHLYLFLSFCFTFSLNAQIVDIPDVALKYFLVTFESTDTDGDQYVDAIIDTNGDGEIQVTEAEAVLNLVINGIEYFDSVANETYVINDLTGLASFSNLEELKIKLNSFNTMTNIGLGEDNQSLTKISFESSEALESIDLGNKPNLTFLDIRELHDLTTLDLSNYSNLATLWVNANSLASLDVTNNINLNQFYIYSALSLTSINLTQNSNLQYLRIQNMPLSTVDISQNTNLVFLEFRLDEFSTIDISQNVNLQIFSGENISSIDFSQNINLTTIYLQSYSQTDLDLSQNVNLEVCAVNYTDVVELDFSNNPELNDIELYGNQDLTTLNFKNGTAFDESTYIDFYSNDNLNYVCADTEEVDVILPYVSENCEVNTYCNFVPSGEYYAIEGANRLDIDSSGCDVSDNVYPSLKFNITDGINNGIFVSNTTGNYNMPLQEGIHTITPVLENPTYFTVSPSSLSVNFPTDDSPFNQDFCLTPNGTYNDLEIIIVPLEVARPGFLTHYKLVYKNKGNTTISDTIELLFNDDLINFVTSTPTVDSQVTGLLNWSFTNIEPFETREILFQMILNPPTDANFPVNGGDYLDFESNIFPITGDETESDNNVQLQQLVVNSFDPNDKTCLEGETINPDMVGKFVHYLIRFENTGIADAINIVVKDEIDMAKYDVSTLIPLDASHDFITRTINTNTVEFIFENINLPFDDATNDGYVLFKIQTVPTLILGDTFENDSEIYFDYNFPIITNNEQTTVEENLGVDEYSNINVSLYPNPVNNYLTIETQESINSVSIYGLNGHLLQRIVSTGTNFENKIDVSKLSNGIYFVEVQSDNGEHVQKIIKQ